MGVQVHDGFRIEAREAERLQSVDQCGDDGGGLFRRCVSPVPACPARPPPSSRPADSDSTLPKVA